MLSILKEKSTALTSRLNYLTWFPPLISRITIGWVFMMAGYGKLGSLAQVIGYFESLGIPFASVQAPFIAVLELLGGIGLIFGFGTRFFSFMLASTMFVAIMTAHIGDIEVFSDVFKIYEFVYILVFLFLMINGAGRISLDKVFKDKMKS